MTAVLGAGPHGRQIAALIPGSYLFDDFLPGHIPCALSLEPWVVGAAFPAVRRSIAEAVSCEVPAYHRGIVQFPNVDVGIEVEIGEHTHLLYKATVQHGCRIGSFVTIAAGATLCGEVTVADDVFIGAGATIIHGGIKIGRGAIIGAGAVVIDNVPAGATVAGNPARVLIPAWTDR